MSQVLVLNSSFEPMPRMAQLKRAIRLIVTEKADAVEEDRSILIRSGRRTLAKPVVIRLRRFVKVPKNFRKTVTNTFLFARDHYTCQYCNTHESMLKGRDGLEREHVIPLSRGGTNEWTNVVTACTSCNTKKADRTPAEAGMTLLSVPREPHMVFLKWKVRKLTALQAYYIRQFYGPGVLDDAMVEQEMQALA